MRSLWWDGACQPLESSTGSAATPGAPTGERVGGFALSEGQTTSALNPTATGPFPRQPGSDGT